MTDMTDTAIRHFCEGRGLKSVRLTEVTRTAPVIPWLNWYRSYTIVDIKEKSTKSWYNIGYQNAPKYFSYNAVTMTYWYNVNVR